VDDKRKHDVIEQLGAVYGKRRAKKIWKKILEHKAKHPNKAFSFIFAEDGSFKAVEKPLKERNNLMRLIEKIKEWYKRAKLWYKLFSGRDEEVLFLDVLYTKGVEAYAYHGKNLDLFTMSRHYRKGWSDFARYEKKAKPTDKDRKRFIREYVTGVSCAYVHGNLKGIMTQTAQDILEGKPGTSPFFQNTSEHMQAGFKNAIIVMNNQLKLMKTDERTQRIKKIYQKQTGRSTDRHHIRETGVVENKVVDNSMFFAGTKALGE